MRKWIAILVLVLLFAVPASAKYIVRIDNVRDVCQHSSVDVPITIEPDGADPLALGGFDLRISYVEGPLYFQSASAGDFYSECGWEYFHASYGGTYDGCCSNCVPVRTIELIGIAETNNGPVHPSCFTPSGVAELASLRFLVPSDSRYLNTIQPINFYWAPEGGCGENSFSDQSGNSLLIADNVYNWFGSPFPAGWNCSGPDPSCESPTVSAYVDYFDGSVEIVEQDFAYRGDLNVNGLPYEVGDAITYSNYFIYGLGAFHINLPLQVQASEVNCDGYTLSIADLVYLIRIIVHDADPYCTCDQSKAALAKATEVTPDTSLTDTIAFFGAEGYQGQHHIPFEFHVANSVPIAALQMRVTYSTRCVTPDFDPVIGDGESVQYSLVGRAANFINNGGSVVVKSVEPGVLLVYMYPGSDETSSDIPAGSDVLLRVYFDAKPPITPIQGPVSFVAEGYDYNLFSTVYGQAIQPTTVNGTFHFVPRPSCPVLFSHDGTDFVQENPLLTACEASGYRDVVTDYYHSAVAAPDASGKVRFQLRELENETTYLDDVELITIDHSASSMVACGTDGTIRTYDGTVQPVSAVDENGVDHLAEVVARDGKMFTADGPGSLVVTFADGASDDFGVELLASRKAACPPPPIPDTIILPLAINGSDDARQLSSTITTEVLSDGDVWQTVSTVPPRQKLVDQTVWIDHAARGKSGDVSIRISWTDGYATDAITKLIAASERPTITTWRPSATQLMTAGVRQSETDARVAGPVKLTCNDAYAFEFDAGRIGNANLKRDYIIKATGRYQPSTGANQLADGFQLFDNYPNPFNPTTTISYSLPSASHVTLAVFNTLGQKVATLVDGEQAAGMNTVEWNGCNASGSAVASGIYYYRLETSDFTQTKKMILLK